MLALVILIALSGAVTTQSAISNVNYANDLCGFHNRLSARFACSQVRSVLQSSNVDPNRVDRLIHLLKTGDHRGALAVADALRAGLKAGSPEPEAALEYLRAAMLDIQDSGKVLEAAQHACSLHASKPYCFFYASRLLNVRDFEAARSVFEELLQKSFDPEDTYPDSSFRSRVLLLLSLTTQGQNADFESKELLEQARQALDRAPATNEDDHRRLQALLLRRKAWLQYVNKELNATVDTYRRALVLHENLAAKYPRTYRPEIAWDLYRVASVYLDMGNSQEAEKLLHRALDIYETLARTDPGVGENGWAATVADYARLNAERRPEESERMYQHTLELMRRLAKQMPEAYEPDLADTLDNFYGWYSDQGLLPESREIAEEDYSVSKRLWQRNSKRHGYELTNAAYHLADSLYQTGEPVASSCPYLKEALPVAPDALKGSITDKMNLFDCH